jgi:hypothetical protein
MRVEGFRKNGLYALLCLGENSVRRKRSPGCCRFIGDDKTRYIFNESFLSARVRPKSKSGH